MKKLMGVLAGATLLIVGGAALAAAPAKAKKTAEVVPAGDVKWMAMPGAPDAPDAPKIAFVRGDMKSKGKVSFFLKVPGGFNSGLHTHDADYQATVISGTFTEQLEGEADATAKQLGPGSWWSQPAKQKHLNRCVGTEGCVVFVQVDGPFSFTPATAPAAAPSN